MYLLTFLLPYDKLLLKIGTFIIQLDVLLKITLCTKYWEIMTMTQDEYRHVSWNIYKWIRKNDPDLSLQINRELYSIAEKVMVEYHIRMSIDEANSYDEVKYALEMLADVENTCRNSKFNLTYKIAEMYLKFN